MRRRVRRALLLGIVIALAALAGTVWLLWPRTAISRENAEKVCAGMTRAEVEAILGGPARDEATGPIELDYDDSSDGDMRSLLRMARVRLWMVELVQARDDPDHYRIWQSNQVAVWVEFGADGRVRDCHCLPMRRVGESPLAAVRRWLGL